MTLAAVDNAGSEQDLLLKSQGSSGYGLGAIEVLYEAANHRVQVWTYTGAQGWVQRGADIPVTFQNGDRFGARATAAGQVQVYQNSQLLGTRDVTAWPYYANSGYIGLWFISASNAMLDDFGGGTVAQGGVSRPFQDVAFSSSDTGTMIRLAGWTKPLEGRPLSDGPSLPAAVEQHGPTASRLFDQLAPSTTITYTYDGLYRLTDAAYSDGRKFHYDYDAVGNILTRTQTISNQVTITTTYGYDAANRLTAVNGVTYTWDNNGNLLSNGAATYSYDAANRLKTIAQGGHAYVYTYNGQGDRLTQSVDGAITRYTLDLNAGLTQVLRDGIRWSPLSRHSKGLS